MKAHSQRMTNELGETVIIHANEKDKDGVPGLLLSVTGPDEEQELHVTRKEAVEVLDALSKLMRPRSR